MKSVTIKYRLPGRFAPLAVRDTFHSSGAAMMGIEEWSAKHPDADILSIVIKPLDSKQYSIEGYIVLEAGQELDQVDLGMHLSAFVAEHLDTEHLREVQVTVKEDQS